MSIYVKKNNENAVSHCWHVSWLWPKLKTQQKNSTSNWSVQDPPQYFWHFVHRNRTSYGLSLGLLSDWRCVCLLCRDRAARVLAPGLPSGRRQRNLHHGQVRGRRRDRAAHFRLQGPDASHPLHPSLRHPLQRLSEGNLENHALWWGKFPPSTTWREPGEPCSLMRWVPSLYHLKGTWRTMLSDEVSSLPLPPEGNLENHALWWGEFPPSTTWREPGEPCSLMG